jgi:type II secretory pathway pseudopilin PulG
MMQKQAHNEAGESLVEVLISLVIIGIIVSAFFAAISTTSKATSTQRDTVKADAVLRDYAETAKQAVRDTCTSSNAGAPVTVTLPPEQLPSGFSVTSTGLTCPSLTTPPYVNKVDITATLPNGVPKVLSINVRTP